MSTLVLVASPVLEVNRVENSIQIASSQASVFNCVLTQK
jgi:hypothetical protein